MDKFVKFSLFHQICFCNEFAKVLMVLSNDGVTGVKLLKLLVILNLVLDLFLTSIYIQ